MESFRLKVSGALRPYCHEVLTFLKEKGFEIGIFTAAEQDYSEKILKLIDPMDSIFTFKLFRPHCI